MKSIAASPKAQAEGKVGSRADSRLPTFESPFLEGACRVLEKRTKALKHQGVLTWETEQPDEFEWITINFLSLLGGSVIIQLVEDNRVNAYIRSTQRNNRGKVFFSREDIIVTNDSKKLVEAIESTIRYSVDYRSKDVSDVSEAIDAVWNSVELRIKRFER